MSALPERLSAVTTLAEADAWEADALAAIDAIDDPDAAEALLARIKLAEQAIRLSRLGAEREQRWGRVRLLGERRYGELLGPVMEQERDERGRVTGGNTDGATRKAKHDARQVYSVPEPVFNEYVEGAPAPTRTGLLREADKMAVHYSSATDEWATPQDFFDAVHAEFGFELDVCALPSSAKCERYFGPDDNGLEQDWAGVCWMNPPYGSEIGHWVRKARESAEAGATVVCLVPARTDTAWWHDHCGEAEVRFIKGRLRFGNAEASAPFPNALVIFGREAHMSNWEWR